MVAWLLIGGCGGAAEREAVSVGFDATLSGTSARTVQGALDELYVRCNTQNALTEAASPVADPINSLAARVQVLELKLSELESKGVFTADKVTYDPRKTRLAGKTVQEAVDELEARVALAEEAGVDHGKAGPALFELRDKHGNLVQAGSGKGGPPGGPNGGGPSGGAPTGPPMQGGGAPGGGMQGGGAPGGGQQGGGQQPGGGR